MCDCQDLVLLLREGLLDLGQLRPPADGPIKLCNVGSIGREAVGEAITKVASAQNESILALLDKVGSDKIPSQGTRAGNDERLRGGISGLEELTEL